MFECVVGRQFVICIHPDLNCLLACACNWKKKVSWTAGPGAGQAAMGTRRIWIPGDKMDQFPKLSYLCLPDGKTLWTSETAPAHDSLWRGKESFCLAFVFPWPRIVTLTGVFLIGLIKACWQPMECQNLTKFVQCWKRCDRRLKSESGELNKK